MLSNDQDNNPATEIQWSFDIWGEFPDYEGDPNEDMVFFSSPDIETTMPTIDAPKLFNLISDHCTTNSKTDSELGLDIYPNGKIFKNTKEFPCQLSYFLNFLFRTTILCMT